MELKECKYRLPCNWCDKYDRRCEHIEFEIAKMNYREECEHDWTLTDHRGSRDIKIGEWTCSKCGEVKRVINGVVI